VGNQNVFLYHEKAFLSSQLVLDELQKKVLEFCHTPLILIPVPESKVPLQEAVKSYLFNSQLVTMPDGSMNILAPSECLEIASVQKMLREILDNPANPIKNVHYFNLQESMRNGGGPACLRLRIVLNEHELHYMHPDVLWSERLYGKLKAWIKKHYRDRLLPNELADPQLLKETQTALDELTKILNLGPLYSFQSGHQ
jgi:succinylarginine dihydrolase